MKKGKRILKKLCVMFLLASMLAQSVVPAAVYAAPVQEMTTTPEEGSQTSDQQKDLTEQTAPADPKAPQEDLYTLDFGTPESGIEITAEKEAYAPGETVVLTVTNSTGREIEQVEAVWGDNLPLEVVGADENYVFTMPAGNVSVRVKLKETVETDEYPLNTEGLLEKGIEILSEKEFYGEGEKVSFTIRNTSGKEILGVKAVWGEEQELSITEEGGTYSFVMPKGAVTIRVELDVPSVTIISELKNASAVFDKEEYKAGDQATVIITPEDGFAIAEEFVSITAEGAGVSFEAEKNGTALTVTFTVPEKETLLTVEAKQLRQITFSYKDLSGADRDDLFTVKSEPEEVLEGTEVTVSVAYHGSIGWTALAEGNSGKLMIVQEKDHISFEMPDEDVTVSFQEIEDYNTGDLQEGDTQLGEDAGSGGDVTTQKEFEPDVMLGKTAKWDDIEEGTATLTLTEKDTSDMADAPSDYIIVLDRTASMTVDYMSVAGYPPRDENGIQSSVCMNPNHYYMHNGRYVKLIDYRRGQYLDNGEYFELGYDTDLWNYHADSSGRKIAPRGYNGCIDRLMIAQNAIKQIMNVLQKQNDTILRGGEKNRVMYWSFAGPCPSSANGLWNEVPEFTEDIAAAKAAIQYECSGGTFYYSSFEQILKKLQEKQKDENKKNIPTKVIFVSDGAPYDNDWQKNQIVEMSKKIQETESTELYTILIGDTANSDAGRLLKSYVKEGNFATVTQNWSNFLDTITKVQQKKFCIDAVEKVLTDKIDTKYWEVIGEPVLTAGNGSASLNSAKDTLTWKIPEGEGKTYTCKLKLKLKDEYRYLLADTHYPTNQDEAGATAEDIKNDPSKAGAVIRYQIKGGKYNTQKRTLGIKTPKLKYGTVNFEGQKQWLVEGSNADSVTIHLKRTMPGTTAAVEINNETTNVTKDWKYSFDVRRKPDGSTLPLIKYNNAGQEISYEVVEELPDYYHQADKVEKEKNGIVNTVFRNEPFKVNVKVQKIDEETNNPLSGAEFSIYAWSEAKKSYVPYKGTNTSMNGAGSIVKLTEGEKGIYTSPVWLYYSKDNQGKFRLIETKAPEGYFGDWKEDGVTGSDKGKNVYDFAISKDRDKNMETIKISNREDGKFGDQRVKGLIEYSKLDEEGKVSESQGDASLKGAVYKLYAAENIVHQDGTTGVIHPAGEEIKVTKVSEEDGIPVYRYDVNGSDEIVTGERGQFTVTDLELGVYDVLEVRASEGYLVDPLKYETTLAYQGEKQQIVKEKTSVYEAVKKQTLTFYKYTADVNSDQLDPMKGAGFSIYLASELCGGKYRDFSDEDLVQAMIDDLRDTSTLQYDMSDHKPASVFAEKNSEDVQSGKLVKRYEYENGKDYTVKGENEYLAAMLESDEKGRVKTPELPYGRYIVIETKTPKGKLATRPFVINVTDDEHDGTTEGDGLGKPLQDKQLTVLIDRPIMSLIRLMKRDEKSNKVVLKEGAAYVIHDLTGAWFEHVTKEMTSSQKKEYREKFGDLVAQYSQGTYYGTKEDPFVTKLIKGAKDETANVYIETPSQLPSGVYELEELRAPEGYVLQGHEGVIAKKESLPGNHTFYEREEDGKWKETPKDRVRFVVSNNESVYDETIGNFVTVVRQDNDPAVGKISVYAEGEKLVSAQQGGTTFVGRLLEKAAGFFGLEKNKGDLTDEEIEAFNDYEFRYEVKPVKGAEFEIRAAEDIDSPEGGVNADRLYNAGDLVMTLTTDENGQTWTGKEDWDGTDIAKGLPLGKYTVTQTKAGEGFALSEENALPRQIEIAYAGQTVPVIYRDTSYTNPRQKVSIEVTKKDKETGTLLSGAVFGLYADEDIKNYKGKVEVAKGTLIAIAKTSVDQDGNVKNAKFQLDLPLAKYYIEELRAPIGYSTVHEKTPVDATYKEDQREIIEINEEFRNMLTKVQVNLMDFYTEVELDGAQLRIEDEEGNEFATILSVYQDNQIIRGLEIGKTYAVKELVSPEGYHYKLHLKDGYETTKEGAVEASKEYVDAAPSDAIRFVVENTEKLQAVSIFNKPLLGDLNIYKNGEVAVAVEEKTDENGNIIKTPVYEIQGLPGAEYAIRVKKDVVYPDGHSETLFAAGDILLDRLEELKDEELFKNFQIKVENGELIDVSAFIGVKYPEGSTKEEIEAFYKEHGEDVERQIPSMEEIETGNDLYNGSPVRYVLKTNEDGVVSLKGLPLGMYEVIEVKAPKGYYRDKTDCIQEINLSVPEDISGRWEETVVEKDVIYENERQQVPDPEIPENKPPKEVVYHPSILIKKIADKMIYQPGETAVYTIIVLNNGDVALTDVTVRDSLAKDIIQTIDRLDVHEKYTFEYKYKVPEEAAWGSRIDNVVYATGTPDVPDPGTDENGTPVIVDPSSYVKPSDSDDEKVFVTESKIVVKKTADKRIYQPGETAVYTIEVVNPNDYALKKVMVDDSLDGVFKLEENDNVHLEKDGNVLIDVLPANGKVRLVYRYLIPKDAPAGMIENIVIVNGTDEDGNKVSDKDDESVLVQNPKISITKEADKKLYLPGETAVYTIKVKNSGNCGLVDVVVNETLLEGGVFVSTSKGHVNGSKAEIGEMAVGETVELKFEYLIPKEAVPGSSIYNIVSVVAKSEPVVDPKDPEKPDGTPNYLPQTPVKDSDTEEVFTERFQNGLSVKKYSVDKDMSKPVAGAGFTLYAAEDVYNLKGMLIYAAGEEIETAMSSEDGIARFKTDLPLGVYKVKETKAPEGHYSSAKEIIFDLTRWDNDDSEHFISMSDFVENPITKVDIRVVDDMTYQNLGSVSIRILDEDGQTVDVWITQTGTGYAIKGLNVNEKYTIEEVVPRTGYLTNYTGASIDSENAVMERPQENKVSFTINDVPAGTTEGGKIDKNTIPEETHIVLENRFVVGEVRINKDGERLESWSLIDKLTAFVKSLFTFRKQPLSGVEFTVYAAEDIVHPDGLTGVIFKKGDIVSTGVRGDLRTAVGKTDKLGVVSFEEMYLGSYELLETATVDGFNLDTEPKPFVLAYVDGHTSPVKAADGDIDWTNERQMVRIEVVKRDKDHPDRTLSGAVFALYSGEDIKNYQGQIIVKKETLLELSESNEDGIAVFESDLPLGRYLIKEVTPPSGYTSNNEVIEIDASYDPEKDILEFREDFSNEITKISVSKVDKELKIPISGAELELRDSSGKVVASWISSEKEAFYMEGLPIGTYTLVETKAPEGYLLQKPLIIEVKDTPEEQKFTYENEFDPDLKRVEVDKSTIEMTQVNDTFKYSIDTIRNNVAAALERFFVTDKLPEEVRLQSLYTGTYNEAGTLTVEYRTNKNQEWKVWKKNLSRTEIQKLEVSSLSLENDEYITEFRMNFGKVKAGFTSVKSPVYMVTVAQKGDSDLKNEIRIWGTKDRFEFLDGDITHTKVYENSISGNPVSPDENKPQYEITGNPEEGRFGFGLNKPGSGSQGAVMTGDHAETVLLCVLLAGSALGFVILQKKKHSQKNK